ncbi:MAG: InlB B-repeat-containing protein [Eubacterium sp.]|nr:InlB B-repeat-containing protein [Eubacterium sp.]
MKLTRFSKQIIAVVCVVAMVVAGFAFVPSDKANADDYSGLTFTDITNNNNSEFDQKLKGSQKAINTGSTFSTLNVCQYQNAGFSELYIAGPWSAANLQATVNGVADSVAVEGAGLRIYNAANYLTKRYNVIDVSTSDGTSGQIIVFCPEIPPEETTTVDPSAPTTSAEPTTTAEPTTANPWKEIGGDAANQWYYNNNTKQNISSVVNIQQPPWASEKGVYITVPAGISVVDVNGKTEDVAKIDGAGAIVYLSALTKKINEVTFTHGLGTSYIQIKNENGSEDPTTEAPTGETESTEVPTTTVEPTTEAPHWVDVAGSNDYKYWSETDTHVISYQNPGWPDEKESGIYVTNPDGLGAPVKVVIDGVETNVAQGDNDTFYCMGAGLLFYDSTLVKPEVNIDIYYAPTTTQKHELKFKNVNSPLYDVSEYKSTTPYTYPSQEGKIFAGWYADSSFTTPYTETTGYAYAKFIDEKVLTVKFQMLNPCTAVRFVSTIDDCLDYEEAGFIFTGTYAGRVIQEHTKAITKVYKTIKAGGVVENPSTAFGNDDSAYFFTYTVRGMVENATSHWEVTPYFVTPDGTKVLGTQNTKDIVPN